jgi:hypothetical protein
MQFDIVGFHLEKITKLKMIKINKYFIYTQH